MFLCYKFLYTDVHVATSSCTAMYMLLQASVLLVFAVVLIVIT